MKILWLHFVRAYLRIGLFFYFKKTQVINVENVPKDKPVLFLCNHQNALLDALLIATKSSRFSYFLTRAAVFKKSLVSKILNSLRMLPVYRIRDGWSNLSNNSAIFNTCTELLHKGEAVTIFPEGSHNLARRVRSLSKGFTRIVFDSLEEYPDLDLQLVPIGLNFVKPEAFGDSAAMYFGKPINAKDYVFSNKNEAVIKLKKDIHKEISNLTTHIPEENYDKTLLRLEELNVNFLKPKEVNNCIASDFVECTESQKPSLIWLKSVLKTLLILNLLLPYLVWKFIVQPKVDEVEFMSTFRFTVAITLVPIYLLILSLLLVFLVSVKIALAYLIASLLLTLLAVKL